MLNFQFKVSTWMSNLKINMFETKDSSHFPPKSPPLEKFPIYLLF